MHKHRTIMLVMAAAGASITAPGLCTAAFAGVGIAQAPHLVRSATRAGYQAGYASNRAFRSATTTVRVVNCASEAGRGFGGNGLELGANTGSRFGSPQHADLRSSCGSAARSIITLQLRSGRRTVWRRTMALHPTAGRRVKLSIRYNRAAAAIEFTANDLATGKSEERSHSIGPSRFQGVFVGLWMTSTSLRPPMDLKLGMFSATRLTAGDGTAGSIAGPWGHQRLVIVAGGRVYANATPLSDHGRDFSVWVRH